MSGAIILSVFYGLVLVAGLILQRRDEKAGFLFLMSSLILGMMVIVGIMSSLGLIKGGLD